MNRIKALLLSACAYTVLILTVFFMFASVGSGELALLSFRSFLILFLIGCIISLSKLIFLIEKPAYYFKVIIHFTVLLGSFMWLLHTIGYLASKAPSTYFVLIFAFAIIYAAVSVASHFVKKFSKRVGAKIDKKLGERRASKDKKKSEYKPLYK